MSPRSGVDDQYLGDGVYASFDGYHIVLDTRSQHPVHRIALDPFVMRNLISYMTKVHKEGDTP